MNGTLGIVIAPLQEAVDWFERHPEQVFDWLDAWTGTAMSPAVRAEAAKRILQRLKLERDAPEDGGRVMERRRFIDEMRSVLRRENYQRPVGVGPGTIQDLTSEERLTLTWDMNLAQARGHARWKNDTRPELIAAAPCYELICSSNNNGKEVPDWPQIWKDKGGKFHGEPGPDYPSAPGRMIALKIHPIWVAINRFGLPWPPFDWKSGIELRTVRRREAIALGVPGVS